MKKAIIAAFIATSILPMTASAQVFEKDLYFGLQSNSDVQKLQEFLGDKGYYSGPITGNFFSLTLSAVKKFQAAQKIAPISGYFGPKTRTKTNEILVSEGIPSGGIINENGSVTPATTTNSNIKDAIASLTAQIQLLQQQLNTLQTQQQTQQQSQSQNTQQSSTQQSVDTETPVATLEFDQESPLTIARESTELIISWHSQNLTSCLASGDWSGTKAVNGSEKFGASYLANLKEGDHIYALLCGTTGGSTISKTLIINTVSATPVISLMANDSVISPIILAPNSTVKFSWSASNAKNEQLQCTANNESVSPTGSKEIITTDSGLTFKVSCTSASGIKAEKSIRINSPGIFVLSADTSSPTNIVATSNQSVWISFKMIASYNKIRVQELRFQISQGAEIVETANNDGFITTGGDSIEANTSHKLEVPLPLGDLSNIPASGKNIQITNVYARYTKSDGTVVTTTTPGLNNTQAVTNILITK